MPQEFFWSVARFLDASAATKLVCEEDRAERLRQYFDGPLPFQITDLCLAETLGVLKAKRFYRGLLTKNGYDVAVSRLLTYTGDAKIEVVSVPLAPLFWKVRALAGKHSLDYVDALQILTVLEGPYSEGAGSSKSILITADSALAVAAVEEGIRVWDLLKDDEPPGE